MTTFRRGTPPRPASESPERLFDDLPRTRDGIPSLWSHQADVLREYARDHVEKPDVAFELPTGAGKTLPALLIAEWRRTARKERVAYVCPTVQLANQVYEQAVRQGIEAVALHGSHRAWDVSEVSRAESARAIAITTYSTIFNSNPALAQPGCLLFDDAHAAEQYVAAAWSVSVRRRDHPDEFEELVRWVAPMLSGLQVQQLRDRDPDPVTRQDVRVLPADAVRSSAPALDTVLASFKGDLMFRYTMIRKALDRCLVYFGWDGFLIRPYIPPTTHHPQFADAGQRLYISATLGDGGELERAFGRSTIHRVAVPAGWDQRSAGRRFFVFPELVANVDATSVAQRAIELAQKALVIAPSGPSVEKRLPFLKPSSLPAFASGDFEKDLRDFRASEAGVLAVANRYDGIDLADRACRLTVLDGLPSGEHLQERFMIRSLRAGRVLEERLRTRVIQGAGRSTRGLKDYSAVVVLGDDLTRFLLRAEVRNALRAEAQAEISFGVDNSEVDESDFWDAYKSFLAQDEDWQTQAEPILSDLRRDLSRVLPAGTDALAASVSKEVKAWSSAWVGDYKSAGHLAVEVAQLLTVSELRPYRAFWLYLAASWQLAASEVDGDSTLAASSKDLFRKAHDAAKGMAWLRLAAPAGADEQAPTSTDRGAIENIAKSTIRTMPLGKWQARADELADGLAGTDHVPFEQALSILGELLGADAFKPPGKGRADSVWIFDEFWVTLEAKSETTSTAPVSMDEVRQANTQLRLLAKDRSQSVPADSISVLVSPKALTDPDAAKIAESHLFLCSPAAIQSIAKDAVSAWGLLRTQAMNVEPALAARKAREVFADYRLLPSQLRERLTDMAIGGE